MQKQDKKNTQKNTHTPTLTHTLEAATRPTILLAIAAALGILEESQEQSGQ